MNRIAKLGLAIALVASFATPAVAQDSATPATMSADEAVAYCTSHGGIVRDRVPTIGTNNPSTQVELGGARQFCEFTGGEGADPSTSRISVDLDSLVSTSPTLAVLAYLTRPAVPTVTNGANPASIYCDDLGGTEIGAKRGIGGGWVTSDTSADDAVLQTCTFGDGSIIDSWGITYHADGTIRGADLTAIFVYQSDAPPHVFGS